MASRISVGVAGSEPQSIVVFVGRAAPAAIDRLPFRWGTEERSFVW